MVLRRRMGRELFARGDGDEMTLPSSWSEGIEDSYTTSE